ncbi:hypothetical protein [Dactylosporangium sp. CS-033363]
MPRSPAPFSTTFSTRRGGEGPHRDAEVAGAVLDELLDAAGW